MLGAALAYACTLCACGVRRATSMASIDLDRVLDKAQADKSLPEVLAAPISALKGASDRQGDLLGEAFGVKTVADLAELKYVGWTRALAALEAAKQQPRWRRRGPDPFRGTGSLQPHARQKKEKPRDGVQATARLNGGRRPRRRHSPHTLPSGPAEA